MDLDRKYLFRYDGYKKYFKYLEGACWELLVRLNNSKALDLYNEGTFNETTYKNKTYHKQYCVTVAIPYSRFVIKKLTKGDIDQETFMLTLNKIKEIFDERIKN